MNEDKFNMWRVVFATVYLDNIITEEEKNWINQKVETLDFSNDQKFVLQQDLNNRTDVSELFKNVQEPKNRSMLLHLMRVVSHADGDFSPEEQASIEKMKKEVMGNLDIGKITQKVSFEVEEIKEPRSLIEKIANLLT